MGHLKVRETQKSIVEYCKYFIIRDVCVSTTERVVEHIVVSHADTHFSDKMFKSVKQSSLRKDERMDRLDASRAMFWTSLRCCFVYHLSVFLFDEMVMMVRWGYQVYQRRRGGKVEDRLVRRVPRKAGRGVVSVRSFVERTWRNLLVCLVAIVAEAVGASVGTLLYPGNGTLICDRVFGNVAYLLYDCL